jgi:hypothetical protein
VYGKGLQSSSAGLKLGSAERTQPEVVACLGVTRYESLIGRRSFAKLVNLDVVESLSHVALNDGLGPFRGDGREGWDVGRARDPPAVAIVFKPLRQNPLAPGRGDNALHQVV